MRRLGIVASIVLAGFPGAARADQAGDCASAYERAQELRLDQKLRAAREQLVVCAQPTCPKAAIVDCKRWLREVDDAYPGILVSIVDERGQAIPEAHVTLDGQPPVAGAGGVFAADPGTHVVRAEAPAHRPAESTVVLREGDKQHAVSLVLARIAPAPPSDSAGGLRDRSPGRALIPAYVSGGIGLAALAAASYFWVEGLGARSDVEACAPRCDVAMYADRAGTAKADLAAGDVLGAVGVLSLGIAVWLFMSATDSRLAAPSATAAIAPLSKGGEPLLGWRF